jgi:hypothetical protein
VGVFLEDPEAAVFMVTIVLCLWLTIVILNAVLQQIVRGLFWTLSLVSGNHHVG